MARVLYLDCFSGISGDMLLGALVDAGLPFDALRGALGSLALDGVDIAVERVRRAGIAATKFRVVVGGQANAFPTHHPQPADPEERRSREAPDEEHPPRHDHRRHDRDHNHDHRDRPHHQHRHHTLTEIEVLIEGSALSRAGKDRARKLFRRLAEAEAAIHGVSVEEVHLHEVGALDSIVDIVGAVFALEYFAADRVLASPLNVGHGTVVCDHGTFPVPAPATLRLLEGVPVYDSGPPGERVTPTGALLVTEYASAFGPLPAMRVERVGYGAGDREVRELPNVLRVLVGRTDDGGVMERVTVVEFEVDDMNPQIFGVLMDRLYEAGALEVFYAPVQMKKNRPGVLVTVIVPPERRESVSEIVFRETTTLGVRFSEVMRERLDRDVRTVTTAVGPIRIKVARRAGRVVNVAPEFDDCARLAAAHGLSVKEVQALALKSYLDLDRSE